MKKVAVVSAIFLIHKDGTDEPGPIQKIPNWDYILFTNDKQKIISKYDLGAWEIREVQPYRNDEKYATKHVKWMTHLYLSMEEYETVIWVDCHYMPNPEKVNEIKDIINHINDQYTTTPIFMPAQQPPVIRNVQEDIDQCYNQNRMNIKMKNRTEAYLKNKGFDTEKDHPIFLTSVLIKSNTNEKLQKMSEEMFTLINNISFHDQHWLPFLLQKHRLHANFITDQKIITQNGKKIQRNRDYYKHIKKVYICNNSYPFHCELMPSIIEKFRSIICDKDVSDVEYQIYMTFNVNYPYREEFVMFIKNKFPDVFLSITEEYDYKIDCVIYPEDKKNLVYDEKHFYISHEVFDYGHPNVFYLTPLCKRMSGFENHYIQCDVMAFYKRKCMNRDIPVYIIQGNMDANRRDYDLLEAILKTDFKHPFVIKMIGDGKLDPRFSKYSDKLIVKTRLDFCDYHREFLDGYCILPLVSRVKQPEYYDTKFVSSIHYGLAFDLHFILDQELQNIYGLEKTFVYETSLVNKNEKGVEAFRKSLDAFYQKK